MTESAVRSLEASVGELRAELDPEFAAADQSLVLHVLASVGSQPFRDRQSRTPARSGQQASDDSHLGSFHLEAPEGADASRNNDVRVTGTSVTEATEVYFRYKVRYTGI